MRQDKFNGFVCTTVIICLITFCTSEILISTNKPATLSSLFWSASRAVDGNNDYSKPDTCECCAASNYETNPWLSVDFQGVYLVTSIVIYGRTDQHVVGQNLAGSAILLDNDTVDTIQSSNDWVSFWNTTLSPAKTASSINITLHGQNKLLVICELFVFIENPISSNKPATLSSTYTDDQSVEWSASKAVDGHNDFAHAGTCKCCAASLYEPNPSLTVNFEGEYRVTTIVVYGRTDGEFHEQSFDGSTIFLNNDQKVDTINSSNPNEWIDYWITTLPHGHNASSLTFTLNGQDKQLVICEIFIYGGCSEGYFTDSCDKECHCEGKPCPPGTGICPSGTCKPGYKGFNCSTECDHGSFGVNCSSACGACKGSDSCNHINGSCSDCDNGYYVTKGRFCNANCQSGSYGYNCTEKCGNCRDGAVCNATNGHCTACADGFNNTDPLCELHCQSGSYGYNCTEKCGNCRDGAVCSVTNGHCTACADGFNNTDPLCELPCQRGSYGYNCTETCGNCRDGAVCNVTNGHCTTCADGFQNTDSNCKTLCDDGRYGQNCSSRCGLCKANVSCNKMTGHCGDCMDGYFVDDHLCERACDNDTYGYNCNERCGNCTSGCNNTNGICDDCTSGFNKTDILCNTVCNSGHFGYNCGQTCHANCENSTCEPASGYCKVVNLSPTSSNNGVAIGVTAGVVIAVAVAIVVAVIFWRGRRLDKSSDSVFNGAAKTNHANVKETPLTEFTTHGENLYANGPDARPDNVYQNSGSHGIMIHQLWDYIKVRKQNSPEDFEAEFKKFPDGLAHPHDDALANREKNRYREMFPYDHSRVHLKVDYDGESEFINASHIDGYREKKMFIASQGPIQVMVNDFWRMVWQQNSSKIVMLTNCVETGTVKCIEYWPEEGSVQYKRLQITMIKETTTSDYSIRLLEIRQDDEMPRRVTQYHYKAWPDKDVPDSTWSLVQFWREVCREKPIGPVIVHCSAGVGRTGTYIALHNLYNQALDTGRLVPTEIVETLRNQRVKMVQTSDQYVYLHEAVADALLFGTHYIWQSQFPDYYDFMIKKDKGKGQVRLRLQYDMLNRCLEEKPTDVATEIDEYRPKKYAVDRMKPDVIHIPGLTRENVYLLTQAVTSSTLKQCIELIGDHSVKTVITLVERNSHAKTPWSTIDNQAFGEYQINRESEKQTGVVLERTFAFRNNSKTSTAVRFTQFEVSLDLSQAGVEVGTVQQLLESVCQKQPYVSPRERIMIQDGDSSAKGGVLCTLLNERMRITREGGHINILESVISIRRRERSCIATYEQYKYLHDVMLHMVEKQVPEPEPVDDENNIYQNM